MTKLAIWQPSLFIKASIGLHFSILILLVAMPSMWFGLLTITLINHLIITAAGLWPRSQLLGTNWTQLPATAIERNEIAITIDDGPDPDITPKVLDILDSYNAKATFFCIGVNALKHPKLCKEIIRRGHAIENHTQHHPLTFAFQGLKGFNKEIQAAQVTLTTITGKTPLFFRAPAGLRNPLLDPILHRLNLTLVSWTARGFDTKNRNVALVKSKLLKHLKAGAILLLHDGNAAISQNGLPMILEVLPYILEAAASQRLNFVTLRQVV